MGHLFNRLFKRKRRLPDASMRPPEGAACLAPLLAGQLAEACPSRHGHDHLDSGDCSSGHSPGGSDGGSSDGGSSPCD